MLLDFNIGALLNIKPPASGICPDYSNSRSFAAWPFGRPQVTLAASHRRRKLRKDDWTMTGDEKEGKKP
jgi:hypothetical protein